MATLLAVCALVFLALVGWLILLTWERVGDNQRTADASDFADRALGAAEKALTTAADARRLVQAVIDHLTDTEPASSGRHSPAQAPTEEMWQQ